MQTIYETERLLLRVLSEADAPAVLDFYTRNAVFLAEWEPARDEAFYTEATQAEQLRHDRCIWEEGRALRLWLSQKADPDRIIGCIGFGNIVRGAFLSCHLGYKMDGREINQGYMTEALKKGIEIIFNEYSLHRIEANILPRNRRSFRVVEKLGFYNEGLALRYLRINGKWEDHIHMVLLNDQV